MKPFQLVIIAIIGATLGALAGVGWQQYKLDAPLVDASSGIAVKHIPDYVYHTTDGVERTNNDFQGQIIVMNFWATWCPPCRKETPLFVEMQDKYGEDGVQFIGIAIDDLEATREFIDTYGVNYPVLMGDVDAIAMSKQMGNRFEGLPFTVIAERDGSILKRHTGEVKREMLETTLKQLISES